MLSQYSGCSCSSSSSRSDSSNKIFPPSISINNGCLSIKFNFTLSLLQQQRHWYMFKIHFLSKKREEEENQTKHSFWIESLPLIVWNHFCFWWRELHVDSASRQSHRVRSKILDAKVFQLIVYYFFYISFHCLYIQQESYTTSKSLFTMIEKIKTKKKKK